jgi:SAM-dependent methyltransferase
MRVQIKRGIKSVMRPIFFWLYRTAIRLQCWYLDRTNTDHYVDGPPVPPAMLRFRVGETASVDSFFAVGNNIARIIQAALESTGKTMENFNCILDFGCGCGRTLTWLAKSIPGKTFYGTDVDESSIRWCQTHLPFATFSTNTPLPPTTYQEATFDLVYAVSILTHLDEEYQLTWLSELHRIIKPGGLLLLSVHGKRCWHGLSHDDLQILEERGFLFKTSSKLHGLLPDWYHTAYHSREYVMRTFSSSFSVLTYLEAGLGCQDLVVLER